MWGLFLAFFLSWPSEVSANTFLPKSFKIDLIQEFESAIPGGRKRQNTAQILYQYPGKVRFEITSPDQILFVSDNETTWYYVASVIEGEPGELNIGRAGSSGISRFFDALKYGMETNPHYQVAVDGSERVITFTPELARELDIRTAKLHFEREKIEFKNLKKIDLTYLDGHQSALVFNEVTLNPSLEASTFKFEAPPNTRTQQVP